MMEDDDSKDIEKQEYIYISLNNTISNKVNYYYITDFYNTFLGITRFTYLENVLYRVGYKINEHLTLTDLRNGKITLDDLPEIELDRGEGYKIKKLDKKPDNVEIGDDSDFNDYIIDEVFAWK